MQTPTDNGGHTTDAHDLEPLPLDTTSPQFTLRAVLTGMFLAGLLSMCNVYTGLKVGWSFNMSITAALLSYGFWMGLHRVGAAKHWGILENNINQTACSSGASVSSAGLVAPIPALIILTGTTLTWHYLALWIFSVTMVGITVAIALRRQMILVDRLPFAYGIAAAETLREMYAKGAEAIARVKVLVIGGGVASAIKLVEEIAHIPKLALPFSLKGFAAKAMTFALEPTLLMVGVGGLIGFRACLSMIIGSILAYAVIAPPLIHGGQIRLGVSEPMAILPAEVTLTPEPRGYASYDEGLHKLIYKGVMLDDERDDLLALSADAMYRENIHRLYLRSRYQTEAPPPGVAFTTTRHLRLSEPLDQWPPGLIIPRAYGGVLKYDGRRPALVTVGPMSDDCHGAILDALDALAASQPNSAAACQDTRDALDRLRDRSTESFLPGGVSIPPALNGIVSYDDTGKTLHASRPLSAEEAATLTAVSNDEDFTKTVDEVVAGATFVAALPSFRDLTKWLLWPGVTLMVISSLVSFSFSWRSIIAAIPGLGKKGNQDVPAPDAGEVTRKWFVTGLGAALLLSVVLQRSFFEIALWIAVLGVLLSFALALVAARVSGETSITPVGAMGKVTQLIFGVLAPGQAAANLMTANVTGGAASQCADLLHDMKCGYLLGASPRLQSLAQICGAFSGAIVGSGVYLFMFPNPAEQLITEQYPAPAVVAWKAVAELFMIGLEAMPAGAITAIAVAAAAGIILPVLERIVPKSAKLYVPSAAGIGLAFVIPAYNSISMFIGGLIALILTRTCKSWSKRFLVAVCAGIIAGESLTGVGFALRTALGSLWIG